MGHEKSLRVAETTCFGFSSSERAHAGSAGGASTSPRATAGQRRSPATAREECFYYPLWHRLLNGQDRPEPAETEFFQEHLRALDARHDG